MKTERFQKLRKKGLRNIIYDRYCWYKQSFQMNNWMIGKFIEFLGDRVKFQGVILSVDNPLISTKQKSTLYFHRYEVAECELARRYLDRSLPTVELGGSIGGVACVTNRLLSNPEAHVVVECNPVLLPTLAINRSINRCGFIIESSALAYGVDTIQFAVVDHFLKGRIKGSQKAGGHTVDVQTTSLRRLLEKHQFKTINLISDCEGAEVDLVENESEILRTHVKWLIMETHADYVGEDAISKMISVLNNVGFEIRERAPGNVFAFVNHNLSGN